MTSNKTIVTTGNGQGKTIVSTGQPVVSTRTGDVKQSPAGGNQVDIVFVVDTTGSMDDKIEGLLRTLRQFVEEAKTFDLSPQFGLISFGDISIQSGGDHIEVVVPLTAESARIQSGLAQIPRNNGFGNWGESSLEAIQEALKLSYRQKAVKVLVLITDEPALQHHLNASAMVKTLRQKEFLVFVVATDEPYYRVMATENGGVWKLISTTTDLTELLNLFRDLAKKVSQIAKDVHTYGDGSVSKYLAIRPTSTFEKNM